ncbi:hypothetical protein [Pseudochryseolinea flava]|uniref:ZU5 domain-containing protein n=1 Tax=Pseudochryseolinea flava TaxID=2059302 RepID=A0A364Y2A4_9BACT|nr:hypothetical protein [Pseudochryseolinea flava]RAW01003.1 hypothetical protein DQQ10_12275 [Pseudochryseolinea flava]
MKKRSLFFCFVLGWGLLVTLSLHSCSDGGDPAPEDLDPIVTDRGTPQGDATSKVIGTSGGSLTSADGHLTLTVPEGALTTNTTVAIQPLSNHAPLGLGAAYRLSPEGTTFAKPVELKFHYDASVLGAASDEFLWITTQNTDGTWNAMLKSETNLDDKYVTVTTTHFSDWALGRFIDFVLTPSAPRVSVNKSVELRLTGFRRDNDDPNAMDELAPLVPIKDDGLDVLAPLTPIPRDIEKRMIQFRATKWALNGAAAPVSNSNGKLSGSGNMATYTAPAKAPNPKTVAVSVDLETSNKEGSKGHYMVVSNITVLENEYFLELTVDGQTYTYYQYGFNGSTVPDPTNFEIVNCGPIDDNKGIGVSAGYVRGDQYINIFLAELHQTGIGAQRVKCIYDEGDDDVSFTNIPGTVAYESDYVKREKVKDVCESESVCAEMTYNVEEFTGKPLSDVVVSFSGTIYEDTPDHADGCKTSTSHQVSGFFRLVYATMD